MDAAHDSAAMDGFFWDKPRERLLAAGASSLSDPELLSVLLGPGKDRDLRTMAEGLLSAGGGLKLLCQQDPQELCARPGMGPRRAAQVLAALELGRRSQRLSEKRPQLKTPEEIYRYLAPSLSALRREVFRVLSFNCRNTLLHDAKVAEGTANVCPVDAREVFAPALTARATAIILAHNHPSGDPEPSTSDVTLTSQLARAGGLLGIRVLDHLVVGDGAYTSMRVRKYLDPWPG
jgi:DNA repair protein RadC